ncbi:MAG TPA: magnesium transporter CorA family protein [Nitrososphaeraceae archaeon]|jgi:magnesium transporter|nr:magnesium transporter CorA family protein [Nitrososphaeraceae archaeon]
MYYISTYSKSGIRQKNQISEIDLQDKYQIWIDLEDPTSEELSQIQEIFLIDANILNQYVTGLKKPGIRVLQNYTFTLLLSIRFKTLQIIETEAVYILIGKNWLITIHSSKIKLKQIIRQILENDKEVIESSIDILYYNILTKIVDEYEQALTAIEIAMTDLEEKSLYRPSKQILVHLEGLSRQLIILRRYFWKLREIFNFLLYSEKEKEKQIQTKYLKIIYDNANDLLNLIESHKDTINSIRELYIAYVSLQMNDTVKTLTIFSVILLPLTFITGFYGMNGIDLINFYSVPSGLFLVLITMGIILVILIIFFRKKQWIAQKNYYDTEKDLNKVKKD